MMLCLTRRVGEEILIGDDIRVVLVSIRGRQAAIGVEAPVGTRILRRELIRFRKEDHDAESCESKGDGSVEP
jgi:carbon storage regulator